MQSAFVHCGSQKLVWWLGNSAEDTSMKLGRLLCRSTRVMPISLFHIQINAHIILFLEAISHKMDNINEQKWVGGDPQCESDSFTRYFH